MLRLTSYLVILAIIIWVCWPEKDKEKERK